MIRPRWSGVSSSSGHQVSPGVRQALSIDCAPPTQRISQPSTVRISPSEDVEDLFAELVCMPSKELYLGETLVYEQVVVVAVDPGQCRASELFGDSLKEVEQIPVAIAAVPAPTRVSCNGDQGFRVDGHPASFEVGLGEAVDGACVAQGGRATVRIAGYEDFHRDRFSFQIEQRFSSGRLVHFNKRLRRCENCGDAALRQEA